MAAPPRRRAASRGRPGDDATRIAAIDIGSNSIRQIVADITPDGSIRVVDEMKAAPRLGAGVAATGALSTEAMDRAIEALTRMATLARQLGASRVEVVATSAVRDASNGVGFLSRVRRDAGLQARVIDGTEEARLAFRSALAHFDLGTSRTVVVDIGGGSLELALAAEGVIDHLVSLPLGALRLTEAFLRDDDPRRGIRRLRRHAAELIRNEISREWKGARVIGSGGTFTNLAAIFLARQGIATAQNVHGTLVPRGDVEHVLERLSTMSPQERRAVDGLNPERADIIPAGLAIAAEVLARLEARGIEVSRYGIREGILLEAARVAPVPADPGDARRRSVEELAYRCRFDERHARAVQRLALQLFDVVGRRLGCTAADRELLADAALLHDIGYHIGYDRHHKHSYHLILHAELLGYTPTEQVVLANVARYHRGARPRKKHRNYGALDSALRKRIKRLAAILRVADGFDRGHIGAVGCLEVKMARRGLGRVLVIKPSPARAEESLRLEVWGAQRKSELLARVLDLPIEFVGPDGTVVSSETAGVEH